MAGHNKDDSMGVILVIGAVLVFGYMIAKFLGNDIMSIFLHIRMWMIQGWMFLFHTETLENAYNLIDIFTPKELSYSDFSDLSSELRFYIVPPFVAIFVWYSYRIYKKNPLNKYTRIHTRDSLCASEVSQWPWIAPVLKLNIIKEPINKGSWAMSDVVLVFCKKNKLLDDKKMIDEEKAKRTFINQLGPLWTGVNNLKAHEKALLACFLAQLNGDKKKCIEGLRILSLSIAEGNIDYSFVDGYLKKYAKTEISEKAMNKNAYVYNVIATVYKECKFLGKVPPSYFIWLKPVDRTLFYTLNVVGRQVAFCEVAGIFGHGLAEEVAEKKMISPYVDKAIQGLISGLAEVKF